MALKLIIGNKNYSSWSLRPWIAMRAAGIPFDEEVIPLYLPESREKILAYSPTGKVPVLIDGDLHVWDSLAILEYLAEKFPDKGLWPRDSRARARARSISAEMHSGFAALRQHCTMNLWLPPKPRPQPPEVMVDVSRIETIWREARAQFGKGGPFLFGAFGAADAMYAPVVGRFHNYGIPVSDDTRAYMDAVRASPAWIEWKEASMKEPWVMQHNEVDWPVVERV
ncbi:MAG: Glutathione S-transferase [Pseudolabrys sp.]|nr:Glutathione S-transferase [Pseudolabrys sp.]